MYITINDIIDEKRIDLSYSIYPRKEALGSRSTEITVVSMLKGELQRQNKLISSARPFKILQNETKIIKIGQAVLKIFNFKDRDLDNFMRRNDRKTENVVF